MRSLCRIRAISTPIAVCILGVYASVAHLRVSAFQDHSNPSRVTPRNFEVYRQHPLAAAAGGDPTHTGGKFWETRKDPEREMIAARSHKPGASASSGDADRPAQSGSLNFDFFVARVEPIFLKKRAGHARCYVCHSLEKNPFHLEPLLPGESSWTKEQSLVNFKNVSILVVAGKPTSSPLAMHPLAPEAGGDPFHSGGRQFRSQDDQDWKTIAEWIRGSKLGETMPSEP